MQPIFHLQGGVLYVRGRKAHHLAHKPWYKGGILKSTATMKVSVAGHTKKSARVEGSEPLFGDTLEFILGVRCLPPLHIGHLIGSPLSLLLHLGIVHMWLLQATCSVASTV